MHFLLLLSPEQALSSSLARTRTNMSPRTLWYATHLTPLSHQYQQNQVGIVEHYTLDDWKEDMELAKEIGIDAFALNCASIDKYTDPQLALAYEAAEAVNFKVFISFDFAYWSNGDSPRITSIMQKYANHTGQFQYNGAALVSTFVGDSFNWTPVKSAVQHPLFAVPMIQDPAWSGTANTGIDGAFSWYAWPTDGGNSIIPGPMTTVWDDRYLKSLGNKAYMARGCLPTLYH
jgi:glucan endo-1,3-alpha-glucosidase